MIEVLAARDIAIEWIAFLREHRKLFFHEQAPWIGYRVRTIEPFDGDPVFLPDVDSEPEDADAITTRDLGMVHRGFGQALNELQVWALAEIERLESRVAG